MSKSNDPSDPPRAVRGRPRSEKARTAILAAARRMLLDIGYNRLTIEGVARNAGTSKATLYRWWPTKGALVLEASGEEITIGVVPDLGSTRADLDTAIRQLVDTFSNPVASIVIFAAIATGEADPHMAAMFRDCYVYPWRKSAAEAIERGIARGDLRNDDVQFTLDLIVGTVFQRTLVMKEPQIEGLVEKLLETVLR